MALANDLILSLDPALLMARSGLRPDLWQEQVMRSDSPRQILCCSRQSGKSSVAACLALWTSLYQENSLILLLSPSLRQSSELFRKVRDSYAAISASVPIKQESALRLELVNGSRIVSLPGKEETIRGFSGVSLLIVDEASRVQDSLYYSIRPMLAVSNGKLIVMSTPYGKRGFFFKEWSEGENWQRTKITATDCPRISESFLAEERQALGDWWYRQEYHCEFVETDDQLFSFETVNRALSDEIEPLTII